MKLTAIVFGSLKIPVASAEGTSARRWGSGGRIRRKPMSPMPEIARGTLSQIVVGDGARQDATLASVNLSTRRDP